MQFKPRKPNNQPVIASALLAVAFVVVSSRERAYTEAEIDRTPPAKRQGFTNAIQSHHWHERFGRAVDRRLIKRFHCALPSGLEAQDFDLYNLGSTGSQGLTEPAAVECRSEAKVYRNQSGSTS